jgi:hypothetical protein
VAQIKGPLWGNVGGSLVVSKGCRTTRPTASAFEPKVHQLDTSDAHSALSVFEFKTTEENSWAVAAVAAEVAEVAGIAAAGKRADEEFQ